jgi:hypothetical protein
MTNMRKRMSIADNVRPILPPVCSLKKKFTSALKGMQNISRTNVYFSNFPLTIRVKVAATKRQEKTSHLSGTVEYLKIAKPTNNPAVIIKVYLSNLLLI